MNPSISNIGQEKDKYKFTLSGVNVSLANALRRTILNDIPINVIYTQTYNDNDCNIEINTSRLHNEIIKQRLSSIPIHITELDILPGNYILEIDIHNNTDNIMMITTKDFKIKNKSNNNYLSKEETQRIFPPCNKTNMFIDFARLLPSNMTSKDYGEHIKLTAEFSVNTANTNSMFNVVSTCAYGNTMDKSKADSIWKEQENKLKSEQVSKEDIKYHKNNFYLLDAQRYYVENSFDFIIQTVGIYTNEEIISKACKMLIKKLNIFIESLESNIVPINPSETTMENSYDIILKNEDYTLGKMLEFVLYDDYFINEKILSYCGFKKTHPHNDDSIIRIAYKQNVDNATIKTHLYNAANKSKEVFEKIYKIFK